MYKEKVTFEGNRPGLPLLRLIHLVSVGLLATLFGFSATSKVLEWRTFLQFVNNLFLLGFLSSDLKAWLAGAVIALELCLALAFLHWKTRSVPDMIHNTKQIAYANRF